MSWVSKRLTVKISNLFIDLRICCYLHPHYVYHKNDVMRQRRFWRVSSVKGTLTPRLSWCFQFRARISYRTIAASYYFNARVTPITITNNAIISSILGRIGIYPANGQTRKNMSRFDLRAQWTLPTYKKYFNLCSMCSWSPLSLNIRT